MSCIKTTYQARLDASTSMCAILCEMYCLCVMCFVLIWDNDIFDYVFCLCIRYAVIVSILLCCFLVLWQSVSREVLWLLRPRDQIIDVLASNLAWYVVLMHDIVLLCCNKKLAAHKIKTKHKSLNKVKQEV
jgi:hypothetical protein